VLLAAQLCRIHIIQLNTITALKRLIMFSSSQLTAFRSFWLFHFRSWRGCSRGEQLSSKMSLYAV